MARPALMLAATVAGLAFVAPAPAHAQARDKVLIIYGNDKCPESNGEEIVVCRRQPESERYRDPLRDQRPSATAGGAPSQAVAAASPGVNATEIGSCSATGSGGASGCFKALADKAREEKKAQGEKPTLPF